MSIVDRSSDSFPGTPEEVWAQVARDLRSWCAGRGVAAQDMVVLLPFSQLLAPVRRALAAQSGWQPRVETTRTLADSLGPWAGEGDGPCFDNAVDRLAMAGLLRRQDFGAAWWRRDRRGFGLAVQATVDAAQDLARTAQACPPALREAHWSAVRAAIEPRKGPGALESLLLRVAAEWAASAGAAPTDRLFALRPAAWIVVRCGGIDSLAELLATHDARTPHLVIDLDAAVEVDLTCGAPGATAELHVCDDQEAEAQAAAGLVVDALNAGHAPVALVTLDRVLSRRIRALLERVGARVADETGWKLSTTRAAARLMSWLRAAAPTATADDQLEWIKDWPLALADSAALQQLEAGWRRPRRGAPTDLSRRADALWQAGQEALAWARGARERPLAQWLSDLASALKDSGEWSELDLDVAGAEALRVLRIGDESDRHWQTAARAHALDLAAFTDWVDEVLEDTTFVPPSDGAQVVLTPLARAPMRPFGAVVMPGADARHLGASEAARGLIGEALAQALGLPTVAERRRRERLSFGHLLRQPRLIIIRSRLDGDDPLAASRDLLALAQSRQVAGLPALHETDWAPRTVTVATQALARPLPTAADALPEALSASQVEALRACPYRFFARAVLRLGEDDELDRNVEKRDYGTWLHAVLHRFHGARAAPAGDDAGQLATAAQAETDAATFDAADLLPFLASFESFAPAYLGWLQKVEAEGWRWEAGESLLRIAPAALSPTSLHGRIDRIDVLGSTRRLIDYKTGSAASLTTRMKPLSEDTQLAFYAALILGQPVTSPTNLEAAYLTLDDADAPSLLLHAGVADSAQRLIDGLGGELLRLRAGAPLPALGEGATCEYCEMRGLCRRDHWADGVETDD